MPEEAKQNEEAKQQAASADTKSSGGGMLKYIIFGAGAIVVVAVVTVAALMLLSDKPARSTAENQENPKEVTSHPAVPQLPGQASAPDTGVLANHAEVGVDDVELNEEDASAIDKIMESLAFMDYEPDEDELADQEGRMTKEDSVEQVNWLDKEKTALAAREKDLNSRQKELDRLEKEVNKKLLNLEQVESARTAQLAKLYDGMDARSVAQLMANLDDKTVISILPRMKLKNASAVLQILPSQRAAKLSKEMITIADK
jgi:flagellar motility protein MotE (MotC chaperone)